MRARPDRTLRATDMQLTRVGLGSWAMGGPDWVRGWGAQSDQDSIDTVRAAVDRGINWIDTAPAYGRGHAESVIGRALGSLPADERPYVFTKCGLLFDPDEPMGEPRRYLSAASIRQECEASLQRLGVERLDLLQFHWPANDGDPIEECWATMQELLQEGKIRAAGVSNFSVQQLEQLRRIGPVASVQPPLSLIRRDAAEELLPWCANNDVGVLVYSPMQSGLLAGRFTRERVEQLPEDDWRTENKEFREPRLSRNLALADTVKELAAARGVEPGVIAIAATLSWPAVTGAIVGARIADQIDGWIDAASVELAPAELDQLTAALERTGAGTGPTLLEGSDPSA